MRYPGANLNNKRFANLWQSIDFPGDFDAMRLCSLMMRPFSEGVVMGTDEMYWPVETDEMTVARYVATTVFSGVPAIGANLLDGPATHAEITKAWLGFYHAHQPGLTGGTFQPIGDFVEPDQKIESVDEAFVYLRSGRAVNVHVRETVTKLFIANCTNVRPSQMVLNGLEEGEYQIETFDFRCDLWLSEQLRLSSRAEFATQCHKVDCWRSPAGRKSEFRNHRSPTSRPRSRPHHQQFQSPTSFARLPRVCAMREETVLLTCRAGPIGENLLRSHPCIQELASAGLSQIDTLGIGSSRFAAWRF